MAETPEILNKFLEQIALEQNFVNHKLKVTPISSGGANFTSTLYEITFTNDGKDVNMFAKVAAVGDKMREQAPNMYKTEQFVYTKLSKTFEDLENKYQVPQEHRLTFAKFYGCNAEQGKEIIVLENLFKSGYEAFDRFQVMTKEYAYAALRELAKFHALSLAYAEYYPEDFKRVPEEGMAEIKYDGGPMGDVAISSFEKSIASVKSELKKPLQNYLNSVTMKKLDEYWTMSNRPVIVHGDYRANNLLHRNNADGSMDIKIVDLQTIQCRSPTIDLLYFIFTGSDEQFRAQYFDQLIDHYYTQLNASMKRLHLDPEKIFSRVDFELELKEKLPFGLLISLIMLPLITVDEKNAPVVNEETDMSTFIVQTTTDLYIKRLNGVVSDYLKWGIIKVEQS